MLNRNDFNDDLVSPASRVKGRGMDLRAITASISRIVALKDVLRAAARLADDPAVHGKINEAQVQLAVVLYELLTLQVEVVRQDKEIEGLHQQIKTAPEHQSK
jgi:hypothetical protein